MSVDMFLKLDDIEGESMDDSHGKEIQVLAWSWGMSQSGSMHVGGGGGSGKVSVQDLSITKYIDSATHALLQKCCEGKHIKSGVLTVRKAGGEPIEYLKITMSDILVSSISTGGSGGEDQLTENVSFNFAKVETEYTPQKDDGAAGAAKNAGWDIQANVTLV